jgi:predicted lipoprotein with Yx(FWY)xxD motif
VDSKGMTLYYWAKDVYGKSNATAAMLQTWPIFNATTVSVPSSLNSTDFATISRDDGQKQTTYKGWPLYNFANDKAPGDTNGDGVGGVWFSVKVPFYTVMLQSRTDFGVYLVDPKGMTLYYNNKDSAGQSSVSGATLTAWPIFNALTFIVPSALNPADFATIKRSDGQSQSTYKGFPLYYYAADKVSGDATGNGLGGVWFIIKAANFPPTPTPTPAPPRGGGYGY